MSIWWKDLDPFVRWFIVALVVATALVVGAVVWSSIANPTESF